MSCTDAANNLPSASQQCPHSVPVDGAERAAQSLSCPVRHRPRARGDRKKNIKTPPQAQLYGECG